MIVVIFYRQRFKRLKTELAHVHYNAHSESGGRSPLIALQDNSCSTVDYKLDTPREHQFDNLVYNCGNTRLINQNRPSGKTVIPNITVTNTSFEDTCFSAFPSNNEANLYNNIEEEECDDVEGEESIYEELKKRISNVPEEKIPSAPHICETGEEDDLSEGESYDRLDFNRPCQDLKPHYQSTDTIKSLSSKSRHSSAQEGSAILERSFESSKSDEFSREVLDCVDSLQSMTRKTVYQSETFSGRTSGPSSET